MDDEDFAKSEELLMSESAGRSFADYFKRAVSPLAVLKLLRNKPMYGYELSQRMNDLGKGKLTGPVLYSVLYKLEQQGYVEVVETVVVEGHARSYYAVTKKGNAYLAQTVEEYRELSRIYLDMLEEDL